MGLGALATIGLQRPPNLAICSSTTGITARPACRRATPATTSLTGVARACGLDAVFDISDNDTLADFTRRVRTADTTLFARVAILADEPPRVLPTRDGVLLKNRFREASGVAT